MYILLALVMLFRGFIDAVMMVAQTARVQSEKDWSAPYVALREETAGNRFNIFLRCATHLHHHVGQMTYLQFALTSAAASRP